MIALDTNILIYAHRAGAAEHRPARLAIEKLVVTGKPWGFALAAVGEFWSQVTHPRYPGGASRAQEAAGFLRALVNTGGARVLLPGEGFADRLLHWAGKLDITGVRVFDLQIALMALDNGANELWSHDTAFVTVPGIRVRDPLA
jgi:predicted nucleic acid-binding protein